MKNDGYVAALQAFLQKYPQGPEADQARQRLASLAPYRVQLAQTGSKAAAERKRAELQEYFSKVVHEVVVLSPSTREGDFRVISGPMTQAQANSACAALERAHQRCKLVQNLGTVG